MNPISCAVSIVILACLGCGYQQPANNTLTLFPSSPIKTPAGTTLSTRFSPPPSYRRLPTDGDSYIAFLRNLKLKPDGAMVHYYDGRVKDNPGIYAAVLDLDVGTKDLQQCADAVMRIRAEYLYNTGRKEQVHFKLTNGFNAEFRKWMEGYRIAVNGNNTRWVRNATPSSDHNTLRNYLDFVYSYAGSLSLSRELRPVKWEDMKPGDVLIIGGSPGHAETVMDMAVNARGQKVFLLSQSYMPAQEIQILENPSNADISPWYELGAAPYTVRTPQYDFSSSDLKRWPAD